MLRALVITSLAIGLAGCRQSRRTEVILTSTTLTNQLQMQSGDSCLFKLPSGDTVAVWCERPRSFLVPATPTDSKSGLLTVWGEVPFRKPREIMVKVKSGHYAVAGYRSYIAPGQIAIIGSASREYGLDVHNYHFLITEDCRATNCLPVTIRVRQE